MVGYEEQQVGGRRMYFERHDPSMGFEELHVGERVSVTPRAIEEAGDTPVFLGTVREIHYHLPRGAFVDRDRRSPWRVEYDGTSAPKQPPLTPSLEDYDIRRLNEEELREGYSDVLEKEIASIRESAVAGDLSIRALVLTNLRNLAGILKKD